MGANFGHPDEEVIHEARYPCHYLWSLNSFIQWVYRENYEEYFIRNAVQDALINRLDQIISSAKKLDKNTCGALKLEIQDLIHQYNSPVDHIKNRLKAVDSILANCKKIAKKAGVDPSASSSIAGHLAQQPSIGDFVIVGRKRMKSALEGWSSEVARVFRSIGYETHISSFLSDSNAIIGAKKLLEVAKNSSFTLKGFRTIFVGDRFRKTDSNFNVWVDYKSTSEEIARFLSDQVSLDDPSVVELKSLKATRAQLDSSFASAFRAIGYGTHTSSFLPEEHAIAGIKKMLVVRELFSSSDKAFRTIFLGSHFAGMDRDFNVWVDYSSTPEQIANFLASQDSANDQGVIRLKQFKAERQKLEGTVASAFRAIGYDTHASSFLPDTLAIEGLKKLLEVVNEPSIKNKGFKTIFIGDHFKNTDSNFNVWINYSAPVRDVLIHLSR